MNKDRRSKMLRRLGRALFYIFMSCLVIVYFFPMVWMGYSSLKTNMTIFQKPFALPESPVFSNWSDAWRIGKIGTYALNSLFVTATTLLLVLFLSSMAAYAFSRLKFKFKKLLMGFLILGLFLPLQSYFIAQNNIIKFLNISDTYFCLIFPYTAMGLPLSIFLLSIYFGSIPREIHESAVIDGAGQWKIYYNVMLPIVTPGLATTGVFVTLNSWNEFLLALLYIQNPKLKTLTVGMFAFSGQHSTNYPMLFAGLSMVTLPMIIIYFLFNKTIVSGMTEGAVRG